MTNKLRTLLNCSRCGSFKMASGECCHSKQLHLNTRAPSSPSTLHRIPYTLDGLHLLDTKPTRFFLLKTMKETEPSWNASPSGGNAADTFSLQAQLVAKSTIPASRTWHSPDSARVNPVYTKLGDGLSRRQDYTMRIGFSNQLPWRDETYFRGSFGRHSKALDDCYSKLGHK